MTGTENGFPDFFFQETTKKEQHDYLELEKHMHSIWVVLIEPFLSYAPSNSAESQAIFVFLSRVWDSTEIRHLACVSQNVKLKCVLNLKCMLPHSLKSRLIWNFHAACIPSLISLGKRILNILPLESDLLTQNFLRIIREGLKFMPNTHCYYIFSIKTNWNLHQSTEWWHDHGIR